MVQFSLVYENLYKTLTPTKLSNLPLKCDKFTIEAHPQIYPWAIVFPRPILVWMVAQYTDPKRNEVSEINKARHWLKG